MAFDQYEKAYMDSIKKSLTEDQWEQYLGLTKLQQRNQLTNRIDNDIAAIDQALLQLDIEKQARSDDLNNQKTKLTNLKTKVGAL